LSYETLEKGTNSECTGPHIPVVTGVIINSSEGEFKMETMKARERWESGYVWRKGMIV
jgi:hypothetical protein